MAGNKSVLMTPDPYHNPGYGGYCPQFKYQIGETFGRTTSHLLTDNNVASSGRLVLTDMYPVHSDTDAVQRARLNLVRSRTQSWGDQKLVENMVPGYTGFVPKYQKCFGKRYTENCHNATADFESDQRYHRQKKDNLRLTQALQTGKVPRQEDKTGLPTTSSRYRIPLSSIAKDAEPYVSNHLRHQTISPYYMDNSNPRKLFMSGYTGFVPRSSGLLGVGYPLITNSALNDFTDTLAKQREVSQRPIVITRPESGLINTTHIYPNTSGLIPHYTGHIPGQKYRHGHTFGTSTENALNSVPKYTVAAS